MKIKTFRKGAQLTQNDLSCDFLDRTTLSKIENGYIFPSIPQLMHISKMVNIPINALLLYEQSLNNVFISNTSLKLKDLYNNKKYHEIIDIFTPYDFITTYYIGLSYYKLDLSQESKALLLKCENFFHLLNEDLKPLYCENLAIAIVTLRRLIVNSFQSDENLDLLKKALNYLELYNLNNINSYYAIVNNIGVYYLYTSKHSEAINFYENFLKTNIDNLPISVLKTIHVNLNIAYFCIKNYNKAIEHINNAIFFNSYLGDTLEYAECHINLFNAYLYKNEIEKASSVISTISDKLKSIDIINTFKICELVLLYNINKHDEILVKNALINYGILKESYKIDYNFIMANVYSKKNSYNLAKIHYNKCIDFLVENKRYLDVCIAYNNLYVISKNENFKIKYLEYKKLYDNDEYNHISINITSPSYFLYNTQ